MKIVETLGRSFNLIRAHHFHSLSSGEFELLRPFLRSTVSGERVEELLSVELAACRRTQLVSAVVVRDFGSVIYDKMLKLLGKGSHHRTWLSRSLSSFCFCRKFICGVGVAPLLFESLRWFGSGEDVRELTDDPSCSLPC